MILGLVPREGLDWNHYIQSNPTRCGCINFEFSESFGKGLQNVFPDFPANPFIPFIIGIDGSIHQVFRVLAFELVDMGLFFPFHLFMGYSTAVKGFFVDGGSNPVHLVDEVITDLGLFKKGHEPLVFDVVNLGVNAERTGKLSYAAGHNIMALCLVCNFSDQLVAGYGGHFGQLFLDIPSGNDQYMVLPGESGIEHLNDALLNMGHIFGGIYGKGQHSDGFDIFGPGSICCGDD